MRITLLLLCLVSAAAAVSAQEPPAAFDALAGRLKIGEWIWVTDPAGREVRGRLEQLSRDRLVLKADGSETFAAADVRRVRARDRDSIRNGTLVGLGIGGALGAAWCIAAIADDAGNVNSRVECAEGFIVYPALGALIGLAVDAVIPGKMRVIYQGPSPRGASRLRVAPWISPRVKGVTVSVAF